MISTTHSSYLRELFSIPYLELALAEPQTCIDEMTTVAKGKDQLDVPCLPHTMSAENLPARNPPAAPLRNPARRRSTFVASGISSLKIPPRDIRIDASISERLPLSTSEASFIPRHPAVLGRKNCDNSRSLISPARKTSLAEQENQPPIKQRGTLSVSMRARRRNFPSIFSYSRRTQRNKPSPSAFPSMLSAPNPVSQPQSDLTQPSMPAARSNVKGSVPPRPSRAAIPPGSIIFSSDIML
ncbi:hypothetical protein A7U60_g2249 [Sanghuangporus baumii]|uniref:Uncharacterized protein n=1 Tax=Sanghuangporus baumii TaxID=108892 RepID=A0A9Q5I303_SANBA|nr:hypothetical protein A7U60_g2249 [Sanghuangporus baumii]